MVAEREPELSAVSPEADGGSRRQPWDRRREESPQAHEAFVAFLQLGPCRSVRAVSTKLGKSASLVRRWARRHQWWPRAEGYDAQQSRAAEQAARRTQQAAYERRMANAEQLEAIAMAGLRSLLVRDGHTGEVRFHRKLKATDIASLIRVACQLLPTPPGLSPGDEESPEALGQLSQQDLDHLMGLLQGRLGEETEGDDRDERSE